MEHHILKHIRDRIKDSLQKIRNLQRTTRILESREPVTLSRELTEELGKVRVDDILPLNSEFKKLLADKSLSAIDHISSGIVLNIDEIEAVLRAIATRYIPNQTNANGAIKQILDSSSNLVSKLEKLYTFIDFYVEENTIKLINDRIKRIRLFVLAIRQHAPSLITGYSRINQDNIVDLEQWVAKLDRFRLEIIEPLKDKFSHLLARKLSGELGEYIQKISDSIKSIEQIYKAPVDTESLKEKYEREVFRYLDIIDHAVEQMERFVNKFIE